MSLLFAYQVWAGVCVRALELIVWVSMDVENRPGIEGVMTLCPCVDKVAFKCRKAWNWRRAGGGERWWQAGQLSLEPVNACVMLLGNDAHPSVMVVFDDRDGCCIAETKRFAERCSVPGACVRLSWPCCVYGLVSGVRG